MKKTVVIIISLISVFVMAFSFGGCKNRGAFCNLTDAYERGYLTREQVLSIAYYKNAGAEDNEELMGENFAPIPKNPEILPAKTLKSIKQTYYNLSRVDEPDMKLSGIRITVYLGTYGNFVAVMIYDDYSAYTTALWTEEVDGIKIHYGDGNRILIWTAN